MQIFAIDMLARAGDASPTRTVQVPAKSLDEAMEKARKTMAHGEAELRPNRDRDPEALGRLVDVKV